MPSTHPYPRTVPTPSVGQTSVSLVPQNLQRTSAVLVHLVGTGTLYVCSSDVNAVVGGPGMIAVAPGQGVLLAGWTQGVNAVVDVGTSTVTIQEF